MNKKLLFSLIFSLMGIGIVTAIWIVSISSSADYEIYSEEYGGLNILQDFSNEMEDSLNGSISFKDNFIFENSGNDVYLDVEINTIKIPTNENCTNWENDCNINYYFNLTDKLIEGSNIIYASTGENKISVNINCVQYSCPQRITPIVDISKIAN